MPYLPERPECPGFKQKDLRKDEMREEIQLREINGMEGEEPQQGQCLAAGQCEEEEGAWKHH